MRPQPISLQSGVSLCTFPTESITSAPLAVSPCLIGTAAVHCGDVHSGSAVKGGGDLRVLRTPDLKGRPPEVPDTANTDAGLASQSRRQLHTPDSPVICSFNTLP